MPCVFQNILYLKDYLNVWTISLAAPSANMSTRLSSVKASDVIEEFGSKIKYVLDGGKCQIGLESTIINLLKNQLYLDLGG